MANNEIIKKLHPIQQNNNIPIVFSTNMYFIPYMAVMIQSILNCASDKYHYDIIILHSEITAWQAEEIISLSSNYNNCTIRLYDVSKICNSFIFFTDVDGNRLSRETYYRLLIGGILSDEYEKAIYLDGDMIALKDIAELYHVDLNGYYVAAVPDILGIAECYKPNSQRLEYRKNHLKLSNPDEYFIGGLLVLNLKDLRADFPTAKLLELASQEQWLQHDQDVMNVVCNHGKAKMLPLEWNVLQDYSANYFLPDELYNRWKKSESNPYIVHFGGDCKPWIKGAIREEYFWKTAAQTPYFETIIQRMTIKMTKGGKPFQIYTSKEIANLSSAILEGRVQPYYTRIISALEGRPVLHYSEMQNKPLISVIVPVYNTEEYLKNMLESIVNQTYQNLEILLIDDGSTDSSGIICDQYANKDARIKVIHTRNSGVATARNLGLAAAKGEWIAWVDSDDWLELDTYEYMMSYLQNNDIDIAICGRILEFDKRSETATTDSCVTLCAEDALKLVLNDNKIRSYLWDKLWRRKLFDSIEFPNSRVLEDYYCIHKLFHNAEKIICLPEAKYHYRQREKSLIHKWNLEEMIIYIHANGERLEFILSEWPQLSDIISTHYALKLIELWKECFHLPRRKVKNLIPELNKISELTKKNYSQIYTYAQLGRIGIIQLFFAKYPNQISFFVVAALNLLYRFSDCLKTHGITYTKERVLVKLRLMKGTE